MQNENENKQQQHYICLGGCKGVAINEGACTDENCANYQQGLVECNCEDESHNNFQVENRVEV